MTLEAEISNTDVYMKEQQYGYPISAVPSNENIERTP